MRNQFLFFMLLIGAAINGSVVAVAQNVSVPLQSERTLRLGNEVREISLDGKWQAGIDRHYDRVLKVPGLATDPAQPTPGMLWYKRVIRIPKGRWTRSTLTLKGARFAPQVYVDGELVSSAEGGMAATVHRFDLPTESIGRTITVEIALHSLKELASTDASAVPAADLWRSNVSSYLWDSVVLRLHGDAKIERVVPSTNLKEDSAAIHWYLSAVTSLTTSVIFKVLNEHGKELVASDSQHVSGLQGLSRIDLHHRLLPWSPEHPNLYRLRTEVSVAGQLVDATEQSFALRSFAVQGLGFELNGKPYPIRMGTVVWHRWTRDPEAKDIAFDSKWFERNIVLRLKYIGANALRFHLGLPPEELLDLCDRDGLAVQMEWPFFHGIQASKESLTVQWQAWLDTAMRHPSVVIVQPWNETDGEQVRRPREVLDTLLKAYPAMVVNHRDVTPVHKYWWSLFENLGLYYDSAKQFNQAVMVDEFGGDYLDGNGDPGSYPSTKETMLRFLGHHHNRHERLQLQADANGRVAEYWRRLGVAGFSPFCILASPQDGNTWFLGPTNLRSPKLKPVWQALAAAWAPRSLSLEIWNRNFLPGERLNTPLWFFNDTDEPTKLHATIHVIDAATGDDRATVLPVTASLGPHQTKSLPVSLNLPTKQGEWRIEARVEAGSTTAMPIISSWYIRTFIPHVSVKLQSAIVGVRADETELRAMLEQLHINVRQTSDPESEVLLGSRNTWSAITGDPKTLDSFEVQFHQGKSIVLLDAGPQPLGVGYSKGGQRGGPLEGAPTISTPKLLQEAKLFGGISVLFRETAEPESTIQQPIEDGHLWNGITKQATWLWNGLRGGLIVPAADMQVTGLSGDALLTIWQARGADPGAVQSGDYFAYELAGYYAFADHDGDSAVSDKLRQRVKFLVADAPSLAAVINPNAPITVTNIGALYRKSGLDEEASRLIPLAEAGKNLSRVPVVKLTFAAGYGSLTLSQVLTAGRMLPTELESGSGEYGLRYDPVAVQFILNMLDDALENK